jgi:hypothetical protein
VHERHGRGAGTLGRERDALVDRRAAEITVAPSARAPSTLVSGAWSGMKTSQRTPSSRAACASAWAWLPALAATTPFAQPSPRRCTFAAAPRTLNEPVRWRFSAFSATGTPRRSVSVADGRTGV